MPESSTPTREITPSTVEHLASLARIQLTDDEVQALTGELSAIVENVAKVSEVALDDVPATAHPLPLRNVMRADVVAGQLTQEEALKNAPDSADGRFRVSAILGEEQ